MYNSIFPVFFIYTCDSLWKILVKRLYFANWAKKGNEKLSRLHYKQQERGWIVNFTLYTSSVCFGKKCCLLMIKKNKFKRINPDKDLCRSMKEWLVIWKMLNVEETQLIKKVIWFFWGNHTPTITTIRKDPNTFENVNQ